MDGASKFVRGDAVAGIMITGINIVGGLFIGVVQGGLDIRSAAEIYTILTVGDGLVSQLPALLISTAAGIVVTRAASGTDLGSEVTSQMLLNPRVLAMVSAILGALALLPGLPFLPFVALAGRARRPRRTRAASTRPRRSRRPALEAARPRRRRRRSRDVPAPLDLLELEVGYELVPLVDAQPARRADRAHQERCAGSWRRRWASSCRRCTSATTCS